MGLSAAETQRIVTLGAPILCLDTCTILDIVRDITRDTARPHEFRAAMEILAAAETQNRIVVLIADQVRSELAANLAEVEQEAVRNLTRFRDQVDRIAEVARGFGATGALVTTHLDGHVARARAVMDRLLATGLHLPGSVHVPAKALTRVNIPRAPARKGKESMKDCVVVETYLEVASELRAARLVAPIVLASSNTREYHEAGTTRLHADLVQDFGVNNLEYSPNFAAAKHSLGI